MKISNKVFAVVGAALLLASCKNNFAPTDFGGQSTKEYYSEENNGTVTVLGKVKAPLTVTTNLNFVINLPVDDSTQKEAVTIGFSAPITAESLSEIKVYKLKDATKSYLAYGEDSYSATVGFKEVKTDDNKDNSKVEVTFTVTKDTDPVNVCILVPNTVTSVNGQKLDVDNDGLWEEHDCIYIYGKIGAAGELVGEKKNPARVTPTLFEPTINIKNDTNGLIEEVTYKVTAADKDGDSADVWLSSSWADTLSSHVALRVQYDDLSWKDVTLTFNKETISGGIEYVAKVDGVDFKETNGTGFLVYKDVQNFKYNYAGYDVYYTYANHKTGQTTYYESVGCPNYWNTITTVNDVTFKPVRNKLLDTATIDDSTSPLLKKTILKVDLGSITDEDKDGAPKDVTLYVYDSTTTEEDKIESNYSAITTLSKVVYSDNTSAYTLMGEISLENVKKINANGLYIKGEEGDKVASIKISYKQY